MHQELSEDRMNYENDGKVELVCDHIKDRDVLKAVLFAVVMVRRGTRPNIANSRAAKYYNVKVSEVAFYSGQHAARIASSRRNRQNGIDSID